jgi:uncharacterized membrane protein YbhN (UPF0104 family)
VEDAIGHMSPGWLVAAGALEVASCLGYVLVFLRVFDRVPRRFGVRVALTEMAFGAAVSLGGAGSLAVGGWLLHQRGVPKGQIIQRSAVIFLFTSAINVLTLAAAGLALGFGLLPGPGDPLLTIIPGAVSLLVLLLFLALPRIVGDRIVEHPAGRRQTALAVTARSVRDAAGLLRKPDRGWLGAAAYLWCDIGVLVACFLALGHTPPLAVIVLAYQIGYLSNLLPIPGNVGALDGSFVGLFVLFGVGATTAAAATVVYHAIALWIPALWGTAAFAALQRKQVDRTVVRVPELRPAGLEERVLEGEPVRVAA